MEKKALLTDIASSTESYVFICQDKYVSAGSGEHADVPTQGCLLTSVLPRQGECSETQTCIILVYPGSLLISCVPCNFSG